MSQEYSPARDLAELEAMAARLPDHLLSDRLYPPLDLGYSRRSTTPQLTLGAFLLRRRRLRQLRPALNPQQQTRLDSALAQHDAVQSEWRLHYENKLKQEVPARLKQMSAFFRDCQERPSGCAAAYPAEALRRAILQEILLAMDELGCDKGDLLPGIARADTALRRLLHDAAFIWSPTLKPVYPPAVFWWLYSRPA